jgi:isopenicillin-N N-acyltransferase-like protein
VGHDCEIDDGAFIAPGANLAGTIRVGSGAHIGLGASVLQHVDPAWGGRRAITVANLGGCMANSSGINSAGFAAVDTAVEVSDAPPGIFRAFLLDGLLGRCTTVEEAVEIIESVPHLGGTVTVADASGAVATADLAPSGAVVEYPGAAGTVCRTNHFVSPSLSPVPVGAVASRENSAARLDSVGAVMERANDAPQPWSEFRDWVCDQMVTHEGSGALCKHDASGLLTLSTTVYGCNPPTMLASLGPGCVSPWVEWTT